MDEYSSNDEAQTRSKRSRKILQENFRCMEKNDGSMKAGNPNARTIEVLEQMGHYYDRVGDHWRTIAYRKAVAVLRKQSVKIITKEDALRLPCVGERLAEKIEEIVWTNKLRRLDNALIDPADQLMQIYGVGFSQASRWVTAGFKSLDDLRNNVKLTDNQKIGIAHFDDFRTRIPRAEVKEHGRIVSEALRNVDSAFEVTIGGSYRRGATDSGDIDLIITKPGADITFIRTVVLDTLVPMLFEQNFLQAALAKTDKETGTKWHGASALPGSKVWRRIDLLLVPWYELGAALIYFTGNDIFNRSIRLLASKKGMRLNQHGLYRDVLRDKGRQKITDGELVEGRSERKIFEILGVPWRPPEHRIC
jgi:DNA polymerase IV